jgi:hypothetical protein
MNSNVVQLPLTELQEKIGRSLIEANAVSLLFDGVDLVEALAKGGYKGLLEAAVNLENQKQVFDLPHFSSKSFEAARAHIKSHRAFNIGRVSQ